MNLLGKNAKTSWSTLPAAIGGVISILYPDKEKLVLALVGLSVVLIGFFAKDAKQIGDEESKS